MINFGLAREIYGNTPWMVDSSTLGVFLNMVQDFRNGVKVDINDGEKYNSCSVLKIENKTSLIKSRYQLRDLNNDDEAVSIIDLNGPITKNGGNSSYGTKYMANQLAMFDKDPRIKGHIIVTDSGGGSGAAVSYLADGITDAKKPVIGFIEKGGVAASAAIYILSYTDYIISESPTNLVGSIGTMMEIQGYPKKHETEDGKKLFRIYATDSIHKNEHFEEAMNNNNVDIIVNDILNPANEDFKNSMRNNRSGIREDQLTGKIYRAGDVKGSIIDDVGSLSLAIEKIHSLNINSNNTTSNINNSKMNIETLKNEHLDLYNSVFKLGVKSESERVGTWMAHLDTDKEIVRNGVKSGEELSQTQREELLIKATSLNGIKALEQDAADPIVTKQSGQEEDEKTEADMFYASIDEELKNK